MIQTNAFKITLFFPLSDNEGNPFEVEVWSWWRDRITILVFDYGHTDLGMVTGWWQGMSDQNRWIMLVVPSVQKVDEVRDFLRQARLRFRQKAMYFDCHGVYFEEVK